MQTQNPVKEHKKNGKPLILAHRGMVTEHQENTMSAIKAAMENDNCNGCEFDVFVTKDNKVVLFHDIFMSRLTDEHKIIFDVTWDELKKLRIKKTIKVDGGIRHYAKEEQIPLLSDVLEEIKGKDFFVDLEMKAYFPMWSKRHTGTEVAKIIRAVNIENQVACSSFDFFMLYRLEKEHGAIYSGFGYDDNMPLRMKWLNWIMERNLVGRYIHSNMGTVEHTLIDQDSIHKFHKKGLGVGTYTLFPLDREDLYAEHRDKVKKLLELDVDWIETDNPAMVHELIY